jgi:Bacterial Ig domain
MCSYPLWGRVIARSCPMKHGMTPPSVSQSLVTPFAIFSLSLLVVFATVASGGGRNDECHGKSPKKACPVLDPAEGATIRGTVTVRATVAEALAVAGVQFELDGASLGAEDTSAPYELVWDTTKTPNGGHALTATVRERDESTTTSRNNITVDNPTPDTTPPVVQVTSPSGGATVSGQVTIGAAAADNVGVTGVQFKLDGANLGGEDTSAPYEAGWDTTKSANGQHSLVVVARDAAGNTTTSAATTVTVKNATPTPTPDTTPPTVQVTSPTAGSTVSGLLNVSANATDNVGVTGVQFKLDGANLGTEDTTAPYAAAWDTTKATNASHTLTAVARDAAGNTTTAAATTVTVKNAIPDTTLPTVQLTSPAAGTTVNGQVTIAATATDNVGVAGVQFKIDGNNLGAEDATVPYTTTWDTTKVANASHTVTAVARDAAGNVKTNQITVSVSNTVSTSPSGAKLTWAPPALSSPVTVNVPNSNGKLYMDSSRDYIVNVEHLTACGGLWLEGGRNVVVVGAHITIPGACASAYDRTAVKVRANNGTVHLEGILIDGSYTHDGIVTASPNTTLQVENVRVERLQALDSNHPDCLQTQGGLGRLRVDRFSCSTPLQGFFLKVEGGNPVGPADIRRTNFRGAFHAFWQETTSVGPITLSEVWVGSSQRSFGLDVWPQSDAYGQSDPNRRAVLSSDGSYLWFTNSNITGRVNKGIPSTGDFVPSGVAGAAYSSPGYV